MKNAKKEKPGKKAFDAADYAKLSEFVRGYLHEDYKEDYVSAASAMEDFCQTANARERTALRKELDAFLDATGGVSFKQVQTWWTRELGSAWLPHDKIALFALQRVMSETDKGKK